MSTPVASLVGFVLGILVAVVVVRIAGGLMFLAMRAVFERERRPGVEELSVEWARMACYAHALQLDAAGHVGAAAHLVIAARNAGSNPEAHLLMRRRDARYLDDRYELYRFQGALPEGDGDHVIVCRKHGQSLWQGHVRCTRCRRRYMGAEAPYFCDCGWRLMPAEDQDGQILPSTGGPCCRHCYADPDKKILEPRSPSQEELSRPLTLIDRSIRWAKCRNCQSELILHFGEEIRLPTCDPPERCPVCDHAAPEEDQ